MRADGVWCGVDLGTTNVKVLLLSADGRVLWREIHPTPRVPDALGPCADADQLFELIEMLILRGRAGAGLSAPLRGICATGIGEDGVPLDAAGRPLDLAIPWNDRRAEPQAWRLSADPLWSDPRIPVTFDATRSAAKWAWLREHRPAALAQAACWVALTDYPATRWTARPFMSETLAARTACFDVGTRDWLPALLEACGAPSLPPVLPGGTVLGPVVAGRLLDAGAASSDTLVVVGGHDHPMAASVVCAAAPGAAVDSMGTAELVYAELELSATPRRNAYLAFSMPVHGGGIACLGVMELSQVLDPLLRAPGAASEVFRRVMAGVPMPGTPGTDGLRILPWSELAGTSAGTSAPDRLRATLEGCAMYTRRLLEAARDLGAPAERVFATGGWARSDSLLRLRASVFGQPILAVEEVQLAALGAALLAARGCGHELAGVAVAHRSVPPDSDWTECYHRLYPEFRALFDEHAI